jgi:hypothetical protein
MDYFKFVVLAPKAFRAMIQRSSYEEQEESGENCPEADKFGLTASENLQFHVTEE